jgi:hypothetical protein
MKLFTDKKSVQSVNSWATNYYYKEPAMKTLIALITAVFSINTFAVQWIPVGDFSDGSVMLLNTDSIEMVEKNIQFDAKFILRSEESRYRFWMDCEHGLAKMVVEIISSGEEKALDFPAEAPAPDSPLALVAALHCPGSKEKA